MTGLNNDEVEALMKKKVINSAIIIERSLFYIEEICVRSFKNTKPLV